MKWDKIKEDFPLFKEKKNASLVYLDSAATMMRSECVIDAVSRFYKEDNANPFRGVYALSSRATEAYEASRAAVAAFFGADAEEVVFTRNATESLNLAAKTYGEENLTAEDEIVMSIMEHHSALLPFQQLSKRKGAALLYMECDKNTGEMADEELFKITSKTKIVVITHMSNVTGKCSPLKKIIARSHEAGAIVIVDGAQAASHTSVDFHALDADFYAFSAHKLTGPFGVGVLLGKKKLLREMPPFLFGGEMIDEVTRESATWADSPHKFEAGTVNVAGAAGFHAALDYLEEIGMEKIEARVEKLSSVLLSQMRRIPYVHILADGENKHGIAAFTIEGVHPHDAASLFDSAAIAVRAGHHCAAPLLSHFGVSACVRASLHFYNDEEDIEKFIAALKKIRGWMGYGN